MTVLDYCRVCQHCDDKGKCCKEVKDICLFEKNRKFLPDSLKDISSKRLFFEINDFLEFADLQEFELNENMELCWSMYQQEVLRRFMNKYSN